MSQDFLAALSHALGNRSVITDKADHAPYLKEWRNRFTGAARAVLLPETVEQVAKIMRLCREYRVPVTPQGGNTGLVGGQIPDMSGEGVILSLNRMNKIRDISAPDKAIIAEAGVTVQTVQEAAEAVGLNFPFSIASEGSAQIGGVLSTNAGGLNAVKHGTAEGLAYGVEAVLPDGEIYRGLNMLKKNNQGFDVKRLFLGSEGGFGIITAAALKLVRAPRSRLTFMIALPRLEDSVSVLEAVEAAFVDCLEEFELIPAIGVEFVTKHKGLRPPFADLPPYMILVRVGSGFSEALLRETAEKTLIELSETGLIADAVIAQNQAQAKELRMLREYMSECQKYEGASLKHDVSVPVSRTPDLIKQAREAAEKIIPGARPVPFGHLGDGNIHLNFSVPKGGDDGVFLARESELNDAVFEIVHKLGGSFSAEHGIGRLRRETLAQYGDPTANALRIKLKETLDPNNMLNPGKTLPI